MEKKVVFRGLHGTKEIDSELDGYLSEVSGVAPLGPQETPRWQVYNPGNSVEFNLTAGSFSALEIINTYWHNRTYYGNDAAQSVDLKRWLVFLQDKSVTSGDYYLYGTSLNGTEWRLNASPILQIANADWNANYEVIFSPINDQDVAMLLTDNAGDARLYYLYDDLLYPSHFFPMVNRYYFERLTEQTWINTELTEAYPDGFRGIIVDDEDRYIAFLLAYETLDGLLIKETQPYILKLGKNERSVLSSSNPTETVDVLTDPFLVSSGDEAYNIYSGNYAEYGGIYRTEWQFDAKIVRTSSLNKAIIARLIKYDTTTYSTPDAITSSADVFDTLKEVLIIPADTTSGTIIEDIKVFYEGELDLNEGIALIMFRDDMPADVIADHSAFTLTFLNRSITANEPLLSTFTDITLKEESVSDANLEAELSQYISDSVKYDTGQEYSEFSKDELGNPKVFMCLPQETAEKCLNEVFYEVGAMEDGEYVFALKEDEIATGRVLIVENESHHQLAANNIRTYGKNAVLDQQIRNYVLPGIEWWAIKDQTPESEILADDNVSGKCFTGYGETFEDIIIEVDIETKKGTFTRQNTIKCLTSGTGAIIPDLISYPDKNATKMRLYEDDLLISEFTLKPSSSLNMAYHYEEGRGSLNGVGAAPGASTVNAENLIESNKIRISGVDERLFPFVNTYDDFVGDVLSIVDNTNETSEGQFGQFPLYILTSSAIYGAVAGTDTLFSRFVVVSDESGIKSKFAFCTYKNRLWFVSENGFHALSGSNIEEIDYSLEGLSAYETFLDADNFYVGYNVATREVIFTSDSRSIFIYNEKYNTWYTSDSTIVFGLDQSTNPKKLINVKGQLNILTNGYVGSVYDDDFMIQWRKGINTNNYRIKFKSHPMVLSDFTLYKRLKKAILETDLIIDTPSFLTLKGYRSSSDDIDKEYDLLDYFVNVASIELSGISGTFIKNEKVVLGETGIEGIVISYNSSTSIIEVNISKNIVDIQGQVLHGKSSRASGTIVSEGITYVTRQSTTKNLLFRSNFGSMQAFAIEADLTVKDRGYIGDLLFDFENRQQAIKGPMLTLDTVIPPLANNLTATLTGISSVTLNWDDLTDEETGFQIERSTDPSEDFAVVSIVAADVETYIDSTVNNDVTYYYRVRPIGVNSEYSNTTSVHVPKVFVSSWTIGDTSITLPLTSNNTFIIDWGDSTEESITNSSSVSHTYSSSGTYEVKIAGIINGWTFGGLGDCTKLYDISNWGDFQPTGEIGVFQGCSNLDITAINSPDLSQTTTLASFFYGCSNLEYNSSIDTTWDTSTIVSLLNTFFGCSSFNQPLGSWNTSSVITLQGMFNGCSSFNQSVNAWDVSNVASLFNTFNGCSDFDQPLNNWITISVTQTNRTFRNCSDFNQDISAWNMSSVQFVNSMFSGASSYNNDGESLSGWDLTSVTDADNMFANATSFNNGASSGVSTTLTWTPSICTDFGSMFLGATAFNCDISSWDVGDGTEFSNMLSGCPNFDQDLGSGTFSSTIAPVTMNNMFQNATSFDRDISAWDISSLTSATEFLNGVTLSTLNYDNILYAWEAQAPGNSVTIDFGNSTYTTASNNDPGEPRYDLENVYGWTISDGGGV